jgi:hypothetical protein
MQHYFKIRGSCMSRSAAELQTLPLSQTPKNVVGQTNEEQADGALVVRFRAGGAEEMCWHLFTWTPEVKVIATDG